MADDVHLEFDGLESLDDSSSEYVPTVPSGAAVPENNPSLDLALAQGAPELAGAHGIAQGWMYGSPQARKRSFRVFLVVFSILFILPFVLVVAGLV